MNRSTALRRLALAALPMTALLLAGCTSAAPSPEPEPVEETETQDLHGWMVKYAGCMQEEGIDYPMPSADPNSPMPTIDIEAMGGAEVFDAADKTCMAKVGNPPAPSGDDGEPLTEEAMQEQALKLTQCLREQGVDIEDPTPGSGIGLTDEIPSEAFEACGISAFAGIGE